MVSAVNAGFSVDDFVDYVKSDTSFYQGFKNLRYYSHQYTSELEVFDVKNNSVGFLYRQGHYEVADNKLVVKVDSYSRMEEFTIDEVNTDTTLQNFLTTFFFQKILWR